MKNPIYETDLFVFLYPKYLCIQTYRNLMTSLLPNEISLLSLIPSFSFITVLTDFLTIIKYRKNDINKILSEYAEMLYKR